MRTARRSKEQLKITSRSRENVFNFLRPFHGTQMWTINGPMDTEIDEIMCFIWYSREANEHGMFEHRGVVLIQTWLEGHGFSMYPQMGADIKELVDAYNKDDDALAEVRIPVEGMTPTGFPEPGPAVGDLENEPPLYIPKTPGTSYEPRWRVSLEASAAICIEIAVDAPDQESAEAAGTKWISENRGKLDDIVNELISVDDNATKGYADKVGLPITHVTVSAPDDEGFEVVDVFDPKDATSGDGLSPEDDAVLFATGHLPEDF